MRQGTRKLLRVAASLSRQIQFIRSLLVLWAQVRDSRAERGGTPPMVASRIHLDNPAPITERNGFTLLDITPDDVRVRLFAWRRENSSLNEIDHLEPYHDVKIKK